MTSLRTSRFRWLALVAMLTWMTPPPARAEVTDNEKVNFDGFTVFVPCAAGGVGEDVVFMGDLHVLMAFTANDAGGFHMKYHFQPQGLSGIGMVTGLKYQATGVTQETDNINAGEQNNYVNNFRMIGQGPGNNYQVHETIHVTINANGEVTASFDKLSIDCN